MAKVLVTGAAGQVGSRLVRELLARNYEVRGLILSGDAARERIAGLDVEVVEGNLLDWDVAVRAVAGVDAVVHTANLLRPLDGMSESEFFENNVRGTFHLVRAAGQRADSLTRLVYMSSSSVYPNDTEVCATCYEPVDEQHPLRPQGVYGQSKQIGENIVGAHARETGLQTAIVRPSQIDSRDSVLQHWMVLEVVSVLKKAQAYSSSALYHPNGMARCQELERAARSLGQPCAVTDDRGRPWLYQPLDVRDAAHGCVCALEDPAAVGQVFNLSGPPPVPFPEAAAMVGDLLGRPVLTWQAPSRWVYTLDTSKARSLIGYNPKWGIAAMIESAMAYRERTSAARSAA